MTFRLAIFTLLAALGMPAQQPATPRVTYLNGAIHDPSGKPITGMLGITFSLYEAQQGGAPLWTETQSVSLDDHGNYAVLLGATQPTGLPVEIFAGGQARWLGIAPQFPGAAEQPRVALAGVPYAMKAVDADTLGGLPASAFLRAGTVEPVATVAPAGVTAVLAMTVAGPVDPDACAKLSTAAGAKANQIAKYSAPCRITASAITETGGQVGIGTAHPAANLEVSGTVKVDPAGVTTGAGTSASTVSGGNTADPQGIPGAGLQASGGNNSSTTYAGAGGTGVVAAGGGVQGATAYGGPGLVATGGSAGLAGGGGNGIDAYGSLGQGGNYGGTGVFALGGTSGGGTAPGAAGVAGYGGTGSQNSKTSGGVGLYGAGGGGGSGGGPGGYGLIAQGGTDINGNPATAAFINGQIAIASAGGTGMPQVLVEQNVTTDYARARFSVDSASSYWDIAVGGGTQPAMNFFRIGTGNVMSLTPGATNLMVMSNGARLTSGGAWTNASDRNVKMDFQDVDGQEVLRKLGSLPITTWSYRQEGSDIRHIGPMAQDFRAAFGLGEDDKHITTIDADGVALAALQELYRDNLAKDRRIHELEQKLDSLGVHELEQRLATLEKRLAQIEHPAADR